MTTTTITDYKLNAWLAEASYANFNIAMSNVSNKRDKEMIKALQSRSDNSPGLNFTPEQAKAFAARYDLVHHQPNTKSGFSATVFWDSVEKKYVFAVRGSELDSKPLLAATGALGFIGSLLVGWVSDSVTQRYRQHSQHPSIKSINKLGFVPQPSLHDLRCCATSLSAYDPRGVI